MNEKFIIIILIIQSILIRLAGFLPKFYIHFTFKFLNLLRGCDIFKRKQKKNKSLNMNAINIWENRENCSNIQCSCCFYVGAAPKKGSIMYWSVSSLVGRVWKQSLGWCIFIVAWIIESETKKKWKRYKTSTEFTAMNK